MCDTISERSAIGKELQKDFDNQKTTKQMKIFAPKKKKMLSLQIEF